MGRPKAAFMEALAERARSDLRTVDAQGIAVKLKAVIAASKHKVGDVADIMGVGKQSVCRWAKAYREEGLEGLRPKPKKPKPSKLSDEQKAQALEWIDGAKAPDGRHAHWTLEKLRQAFIDKFEVALTVNAIWEWLRKEGRKLKVPRPKHYKADGAAQEAFKKKPRSWRKTARMP
jgi:putative transposase